MKKEFVPYELALRMKQLGFDEPCLASWNLFTNELNYNGFPSTFQSEDVVQLPTYSQAFRWFREIKEVEYQITYAGAKGRYNAFVEDYFYDNNGDLKEFTYKEAELACLETLIEIVEKL
jgi:hypothetical protein